MVKEDYVSFETAKLLKEKGFDEPCECFYDTEHNDISIVNGWMDTSNSLLEEREFLCYSAPTLQMATKWLRENHNLYVTSVPNGIGEYVFYPWVYKKFEWGWNVLESSLNGFQNTEFSSPEEACEAAIKYCLENLI